MLLDPTDPLDPRLLWFLDDGNAVPSHASDSGTDYERATKTIEILNLNDHRTREKRRILKNCCDSLIVQGDEATKMLLDDLANGERIFREVIRQITNLIEESAELSSAARVYFGSRNKQWVEEVLRRT